MAENDKPEEKPKPKDEAQNPQEPDWLKNLVELNGNKDRDRANADRDRDREKNERAQDSSRTAGDRKGAAGATGAGDDVDLQVNKAARDNAARIKAESSGAVPALELAGDQKGGKPGEQRTEAEAKKAEAARENDASVPGKASDASTKFTIKGQHPQFGESSQTIDSATGKVETGFKDPKSPFESISYTPGPPARTEAKFRGDVSEETRKELQAKLDKNEISVSEAPNGRGKIGPDGITELTPADANSGFKTIGLKIDTNGRLTIDPSRTELNDKASGKDKDALIKDLKDAKVPLDTVKIAGGEQKIFLGGKIESSYDPPRKDGLSKETKTPGSSERQYSSGDPPVVRLVEREQKDASGKTVSTELESTDKKGATVKQTTFAPDKDRPEGRVVTDITGSNAALKNKPFTHAEFDPKTGETRFSKDGKEVKLDNPEKAIASFTSPDGKTKTAYLDGHRDGIKPSEDKALPSETIKQNGDGTSAGVREFPPGAEQMRQERHLDANQRVLEEITFNKDGSSIARRNDGTIRTVNSKGEESTYQFDKSKQLTSYSDAEGKWAKQKDGSWKNETSGESFKGERWLDEKGALHTRSEKGEHQSQQLDGSKLTYDKQNRVTEVADRLGGKTTLGYKGDEKQPNSIDYGTGKWQATDVARTSWEKTGADGKKQIWEGTVEVEAGKITEKYKNETEVQRKSDGSVVTTNKDGDLSEISAGKSTYKVDYSKPGEPSKITLPDNTTLEKRADGWYSGRTKQFDSINIDHEQKSITFKKADGSSQVVDSSGNKNQYDLQGKLTGIESPDGSKTTLNHKDGAYTGKEVQYADKTISKFDHNNQVVAVDRTDGHKIRVERTSADGKVTTLNDSMGASSWQSKDGGKTFVQGGSEGTVRIDGEARVSPKGDYEFRSADKALTRHKDGLSVKSSEGHSVHNNDGSSVLFNKAGHAEQSSTVNGTNLSVKREVDPAKPNEPGKVVEAHIGNQVWTRSKEAGKENQWTSNDGKQRTGDFAMEKDGSMHFKDAVGKGELVHKLDGSVLEKDAEQHVRRMTTPDGQVYGFSYDAKGKMNGIQFPDGSTQTRMPDRMDGNNKPVERWAVDGTNKIIEGTRGVDGDGTLHIKNPGENERVIHSDGFEERQGPKGEKWLTRETADKSSITKNELGQIVETKTADGQIRKFGYDSAGHLSNVDIGKDGKWSSTDHGKTWSREGANPPESKTATFLLTPRGDLVEQQKQDGKNQETIRKADGSVLHAENGRYTSQLAANQQEYKVGYNQQGQPNRYEEPGSKGAFWASSDNKTWVKHGADGKPDPSSQPQKFSIGFDHQGNLLKKNLDNNTLERKGTDGSSTVASHDGRKLSESRPDGNGKFIETKFQYDANNKFTGKEIKNPDGSVEKWDARGRLSDISKGQNHRSFAYEDPKHPGLVTSFDDNGNKYAIDKASLEKGEVVYRNTDPAKANDQRSGAFTVEKDGSMTLRSDTFELTDRLDGSKLVRHEDGSMLDYRPDGRLNSTRDINGFLTSFKYDLPQDVLGRPGQLSAVTYGEGPGASTYRTSDGFNWYQDGTGKLWKGFTSVNHQDGTITDKHYYGNVAEHRLDGKEVQRPDQSINIASATGEVHKTIDYWYNSNAIKDIRNQMHGMSAEQIHMMKSVYEDQNPGHSLWGDLYKRFDKGSDTHRWAEVEGYLNKKGRAGEDSAIQLAVDSQEINRWWWNRDRSKSEILTSTRNVLGNATEAERQSYADAYKRMYGKDFQSLYKEGGAGNTIRTWDKYHETLLGTALEKGKDKRSAQEEAAILSASLESGNKLDYFMEAAGGIVKQSGREEFLANGGKEKIRDAFTQTYADEGGAHKITDEWRVQQATDFAETGALRPHTAIRKAGGVFSNDDKVIEHTLEKLTPEQRAQFADGEKLSNLKEHERGNLNQKEKDSLEFYNKMMDSFKSLHYFGADKKAEKYVDQTLHAGGTDVAARVAPIGGHWTNSNQINAQAIESMDQRTFNALMSGTRGSVDAGGKVNGGVLEDGHNRGDGGKEYLSEFHKQMSRALTKNLGGGEYIDRAQKLLDEKIKTGIEINNTADSGNLAALKEKIPALNNMPADKFKELSAGYELQKKVSSGELKETELKPDQARQLEAYKKDSVLRPFMEGREVARQLNDIEAGARTERLFAGKELQEKLVAAGQKPTEEQQKQIDFYKQNAREIDGLTRNLAGQAIERQRDSFYKQLSKDASESLQSYQKTLYETVQQKTGRDIVQKLKDNESFWGNDRKAMLDGVLSLNAESREKLKADPKGYGEELRAQLQEKFSHGSRENAEFKLMVSLLKQIETSDNKVPDAPVMGAKEQLLAHAAGVEGFRDKDATALVSAALKADTDGSAAAKLAADPQFKAAAIEAMHGNATAYDSQIKPLLETGRLSTAQLKERNTHMEGGGEGDPGHPVFDSKGFFKEAVFDASPRALKFLNSPEGAAERERLLAELKSEPKLQKLAGEIIKQGEVRNEDRVRAFVLDTGTVNKDQALDLLKNLPEDKRAETAKRYEDKYDENFRASVLNRSDKRDYDEFFRATRNQQWTTEQSYLHAVKTVSSTNAGLGGDIARNYNVTHVEALNKFSQEKYEAAVQGKQLDPAKQEQINRLVEDTTASFKDTKKSTNDTIVTGAITAGSLALAPFTGGTSLYGLVGISAAMGVSGAGLKYALAGNDTEGVREFAGDTFKYTALAFANQLSAGHITRALGMGESAATAATSTAITRAGLETASAEVKDQVKNGMLKLIQEGMENGGVTNKAISEMVQGVNGLSAAGKTALSRELQTALPNAVRAEMEGATRQVLQTIRMRGQSTLLQGTAGGIGNVVGEGGRQLIDEGQLNGQGLQTAFTQGFVFAGTMSNVVAGVGFAGKKVFGENPRFSAGETPHANSETPRIKAETPPVVKAEAPHAGTEAPAPHAKAASPHAGTEAPAPHAKAETPHVGTEAPAPHAKAETPHVGTEAPAPHAKTETPVLKTETPQVKADAPHQVENVARSAGTTAGESLIGKAIPREPLARSANPYAPYTAGDFKLTVDGKNVPLDNNVMTLGRDPGRSNLVFNEGTVSGKHAQIEFRKDGPVIKDLNSTNGTSVNGQKLRPGEEVHLKPGDKIKLGPEREFTFGVKPEFHLETNGRAVDLPPGGAKIGRLDDNDFVIADNSISRRHANIVNTEQGPVVTDLGSLNGTYVNGKQLKPNEPTLLKPGDQVQFGKEGPVYKLGKGMETPVELHVKPPEIVAKPVMEYKTAPDHNPAATPDAVRESNSYKQKGEVREPLRDGFQTVSGDAPIRADGTWNDPNRPGVVIDRAQDRVLNDTIAQAHGRFDHLRDNPEELAKALCQFSKEKMHPRNWSEKMVDASYNEFRNDNRGKRILLGDYIDRASRREGAGVCQHQALLMKVLGDEFGLDVSLVSGYYGTAPAGGLPRDTFANHAWNEVHIKGKTYIYDPRHEQFGRTAAELPKHNPARSWINGPEASPVGRFQSLDLKPGDMVSHDGAQGWQVTVDKPENPGNVVLKASATRTSPADEIAQLNPDHKKMVIGEKYRLKRSNGDIEEGWQLMGTRQDGSLQFYKADGFRKEVSLKELARENPNIGEIRAARETGINASRSETSPKPEGTQKSEGAPKTEGDAHKTDAPKSEGGLSEKMTALGIAPEKQPALAERLEKIDPAMRARFLETQTPIRNAGQFESLVNQAEAGQQLLNAHVRPEFLAGMSDQTLKTVADSVQKANSEVKALFLEQLRSLNDAGRNDVAERFLSAPPAKIKSIFEAVAKASEADRTATMSRLFDNPNGYLQNRGPAYRDLLSDPEFRKAADAASKQVTAQTPNEAKVRELMGSLSTGGDFNPLDMAARYAQARELLAESPQAQRLLDNWHQQYQADRLRPAKEQLFQTRFPAGGDASPQAVHDQLYELMHGGVGSGKNQVKVTDIQPPEAARIMLKDLEGSTLPEAIRQREVLSRLNQWYEKNLSFRGSFDGNQLPPVLEGGKTHPFTVKPGDNPAAAKAQFTHEAQKATRGLPPDQQRIAVQFANQTPSDAYHMSVSTVGEGANQRALLVAAQPSYGHENAVKMFVQSVGPEGASQRLHISVENGHLVDVKIETPGATPPRTWYWSARNPETIHPDLPNRAFGFANQREFLNYLESLPGKPRS